VKQVVDLMGRNTTGPRVWLTSALHVCDMEYCLLAVRQLSMLQRCMYENKQL